MTNEEYETLDAHLQAMAELLHANLNEVLERQTPDLGTVVYALRQQQAWLELVATLLLYGLRPPGAPETTLKWPKLPGDANGRGSDGRGD